MPFALCALPKEDAFEAEFLSEADYGELEPIYQAEGGRSAPHPNLSRVAALRVRGELVAFCSLELRPMVTMWVHPQWRGRRLWRRLVEMILPLAEASRPVYVVARRPETVHMCEVLGLERVEDPVYRY